MLALSGFPLGLGFRLLDPAEDPPAGAFAEVIRAPFDDREALDRLADGCDAVTYEFEQVPAGSAAYLAEKLPVHPAPAVLEIAQDRLAEKGLFEELGIPTPPYARVDEQHGADEAAAALGMPALLKTRGGGYDGKGQVAVDEAGGVLRAWEELNRADCILESRLDFDRELSIVAARSAGGSISFYPPVENHHEGGILRTTLAPAPGLTQDLVDQAERHARGILERFDYRGVVALEMFEKDGVLYGNEIAPRVHNSGHWTIEGAETSQFENHLRGVLGLPLGDPSARGHAAMVNLIGDVPPLEDLLRAGAHVHLYGKTPRPGRKLGHVTVRADSEAALAEALEAIDALGL